MTTDISVGAFFRKRLGNEALENLIEPLLSGIYGADIDKLSLKSTFPNFKEQEETHGSLIKGMRDQKKNAPKKYRALNPSVSSVSLKMASRVLSTGWQRQ